MWHALPWWFLLLAFSSPAAGKTVHVVFGNHLDIGFDNIEPYIGYDSNVINMYFNRYLPLAVDVSDWMQRVSPTQDRYVYTTHSYIISLFFDCPTGMGLDCPSPATKAKVLRGVQSGAITWHAHPHNAQYEFYDPSLLEFSFDLTHDLDGRFGFTPKHTAILRDVPGLTRAAIPILFSKGIKAVSVGINPGSAPPGVPQFTPFIWRDEASGTQLLAFWRPGGYGGIHGGVNLDPPEQCIQAPGLEHVLCTAWRNDNAGPPLTVLEPLRIYQLLRQEWGSSSSAGSSDGSSSSGGSSSSDGSSSSSSSGGSSAAAGAGSGRAVGSGGDGLQVFASSFDGFVDAVLGALPHLNLTTVTGEIGDTWVFGVASDPLKTANFRAVSRARAACMADPACPSQGPAFYNFSRLLVKVPEHTWGVDIKKTLHDFLNYSNTDFHACLPPPTASKAAAADADASPADTSVAASFGSGSSPPAAAGAGSSTLGGAAGGGAAGGGAGDVGGPGSRDPAVPVRKAPCPNYEHCMHAWDRQAAYIDWALQSLPPDHPVVTAYTADLAARQQLAAVSSTGLLASGAVRHAVTSSPTHEATAEQVDGDRPHQAHTTGMGQQQQQPVAALSSRRHLQHLPADTAAVQQQQQQLYMKNSVQQRAKQRAEVQQVQQVQQAHQQDKQIDHSSKQQQEQQHLGMQGQHAKQQHAKQQQEQGPSEQGAAARVPGTVPGVRQYTCGSWKFELDESQGGLTSLVKLYGQQGSSPGVDWAAGSSSSGSGVLGQLRYSAYCEASYDVVWKYYSWQLPMPWWFPLDFGKVNSSAAWNKEVHVVAQLDEVYESFSGSGQLHQLALRHSFPPELVERVGAPAAMWTTISCPETQAPSSSSSSSSDLDIAVVWQNKTPTRLPEGLWFSFQPDPSAVDPNSWKLHKLGSEISPMEVMINGSQSMHAVSDAGVSVSSADGSETLQIKTLDAALVSPGHPTPFPNGLFVPDMQQGVHFNLVNNIWGTNYIMWVPYSQHDVDLAFRFSLHAEKKLTAAAAGPQQQ